MQGFYSAHSLAIQGVKGGRPAGGISCFVNPKLGQIVNKYVENHFVIIFLESFCIVAFYLNPTLDEVTVHEVVLNAHAKIPKNVPIIMAGDFNCRVDVDSKGRMFEKGKALIKTMSLLNLKLCNSPELKTYISFNGSSTIDLLFCNQNKFECVSQSFPSLYANPCKKHQPVVFNLKKNYVNQVSKFDINPNSKLSNRININKMTEIFLQEKINLEEIISVGSNVDDIYDKISYCIANSAEPKKVSNRKSQPWFDAEAFCARKHILSTLFNLRHCKFKDKNLLLYYSYLQREYKELLYKKQFEFQSKTEEKLVNIAEQNPYTYLRKETFVEVQCPISLQVWESHFKNIFNINYSNCIQTLNLLQTINSYESDLVCLPITDKEVCFTLNNMKNNKAPGHDLISKEHLVHFINCCSPSYITSLFNLCIANKTLPVIWKTSLLKVLYKGKGDLSSPDSYRGIANCIIMLKLFDKMTCNRVFNRTQEIIPVNQYGFMPKRSTIQAIEHLHSNILKDIREPRSFTYVVFIDFLKAFDLVDRHILLQKLMDTKRIPKNDLIALALLLEINYVIVNDGLLLSKPIVQSNGVKQGAPSSPLLYNLLTHDIIGIIIEMIENGDITISIYADDIAIICKNLEKMQRLMNKITDWSSLNGLKINASKTKIVKFKYASAGRPKVNPKEEILYCNGEKLEFVTSYKYLGVIFQQSAKSFAKHIKDRCQKAISACYTISNLHLLSIKTAVKLFNLKVSPVASYGIQIVWPYLSLTDFANLESVKANFLKRALCLSKFTKSRLVYELTGENFFVQELQTQFNLPITPVFKTFIKRRVDKSEDINLSFYNTPAFSNVNWKNPNFKNRHIFTRFAVHGFHHKICIIKEFHECGTQCKCKLCGEQCEQYHLLKCTNRSISLTAYAQENNLGS